MNPEISRSPSPQSHQSRRNELMAAIVEDDETALILGLSSPFPLNRAASEEHKEEPLMCIAARHGRHVIIETLLANFDAEVNITDINGGTPMHYAIRGNHFDTVRLLLRANASITHKNIWGQNALHEALETYKPTCKMLRLLLQQKNVPLNEPDSDGNTIAHIAFALDRQDLLDVLNEFDGIDWHAPNNEGYEPYQLKPIRETSPLLPEFPAPPLRSFIEYTLESTFDHAFGRFKIPITYFCLLSLMPETQDNNEHFWATLFEADSEKSSHSASETFFETEDSSSDEVIFLRSSH